VGRRRKCRFVADVPAVTVFKPQGVPMGQLYGVVLGLDGLEAMRLVDGEGLSQEEAAVLMQVSRPTLCRILAEARSQVARALSRGWAIRIEVDGEHTVTSGNGEENMAPYCQRAQNRAEDRGRQQEGRSCEQDKADEPGKPGKADEADEADEARVARDRAVRADVGDSAQALGREP